MTFLKDMFLFSYLQRLCAYYTNPGVAKASKMNDNQKPIINPAYTVEKFDDEILLYNEAGTKAVYLNDAAHAVWLLCKENMNIGQMIHYLKEMYPEQNTQIRRDVVAALQLLQKNGVIEFADA